MVLYADILSWVLLAAGSFFYVVGAIGLVRLPEVYTRMHAVSVSDTLGAGLLLAGLILQAIVHYGSFLVVFKLVVLGILIFITSPVVTHALAQAALHMGVRPLLDDEGDLEDVQPLAVTGSSANQKAQED